MQIEVNVESILHAEKKRCVNKNFFYVLHGGTDKIPQGLRKENSGLI